MTIWSLSVSPQKPHYSDVWFTTVHLVIRTYGTRYICAEESGSHAIPTHVQAAVEVDDDRKVAFNRALIRAIKELPGYGKTTKVLRKNDNAFKYVSKEDGRKEFVGFTEDEISELRVQYLQESGASAGSNWPFYILARKLAVKALNECEDGYELLGQPVITLAATLLSYDLITSKEYNRVKNNSPIIRINLERMKIKWQEAVHAIRLEILAVENERIEAKNLELENARKVSQVEQQARHDKKYEHVPKEKRPKLSCYPCTNLAVVNPVEIEAAVAFRVADLDAESIL